MKTYLFPRLLCCALFPALGILWGGGHAAPVNLSDGPLGTETRVPPNIWMTVDDSSSMLRTYNPDNIGSIERACWTSSTSIKECVPYDETNGAQGSPSASDSGWSGVDSVKSLFKEGQPPLMASAFNGLAYDPLLTYTPPKKADGTFLRQMDATRTSNWSVVQWQDGATWPGRPLLNLRDARYGYSQEKYNLLKNKYMRSAGSERWDLFEEVGGEYRLPPHYYKTSIKWCNTTRPSGDLAGSADPGASFSNCQDDRDDTYQYPYYYSPFGEHTGKTDNLTSPAFELVVLDFAKSTVNGQSSITHNFFNEETSTMGSITRTFAEEATNYANWAAYYQNRLSATKTTASQAFSDIDSSGASTIPRVGFSSINRLAAGSSLVPGNSYRNIAVQTLLPGSFQGTQRNDFFDRLLSFRYTWAGTPLQVAMIEVGKEFEKKGGAITLSCQRNYHILFTDGMWNVSPTSNPIGNEDNTVTGTLTLPLGTSVYGSTLASGSHWPDPIRDYKSTSGTLADIALHYWRTDLRTDLSNDVVYTNKDPANWQHLNFTGMGFGVRGTLPSKDQAATLAKMGNGSSETYAWPKPSENSIANVDDLWHASVNGFGRYVAAASPDEFRAGLRSILAEILNLGGARSGVGFTHPDLTAGTQYTYSVAFEPGWNGDVIRKEISSSGTESAIASQKTAASNLKDLLTVTSSTPKPWETERKIFTRTSAEYGPTYAVPFTATGLATSPLISTLGSSAAQQANVIAYLRGDRSREGDALGKFRVRGNGPLGDIVNAKPVVVTTPSCVEGKKSGDPIKCSYDETNNPGYEAFYNSKKGRKTMVYVAANDGMLHAFDEALNEKWAYVPMDLFRPQNKGGIINLTYQESNPTTPFHHYSYVDATPRAFDVVIKGDWRTILVGGLGKGGTSYYALDVTDAGGVANEAGGAQQKSLWEFTDDNMGYTYGRVILAKTNAEKWNDGPGKEKWVAIIPSGYNNGKDSGQPKSGTGKGYLFFVDLETGKKLHEIVTSEGSPDTPLGLVHIGGYVEKYTNQLVTAVYGGDQQGNLWRFNLENPDYKKWKVEKMAVLKDKNGNKQWVTMEPWPQLDGKGGRWIFVGTGGFRNNDDLISTVNHTFYAFRDGDEKLAESFTDRTYADLTPISTADPATAPDTNKGWYENMDAGYHVNVTPVSAFGKVVYAANKYVGSLSSGFLAGELCSSAVFTGRLYARDIRSAKTALKVGGTSKHYETFASGAADITLTKVDDGEEGIMISVTGLDGSGLDQEIKPKLDAMGGAGTRGVPVRTNIRYIN